jgi:hypothetical protein
MLGLISDTGFNLLVVILLSVDHGLVFKVSDDAGCSSNRQFRTPPSADNFVISTGLGYVVPVRREWMKP